MAYFPVTLLQRFIRTQLYMFYVTWLPSPWRRRMPITDINRTYRNVESTAWGSLATITIPLRRKCDLSSVCDIKALRSLKRVAVFFIILQRIMLERNRSFSRTLGFYLLSCHSFVVSYHAHMKLQDMGWLCEPLHGTWLEAISLRRYNRS